MQAQHLCSCHCRRLFCFESRFTGEAGAQRWVGEEWLMSGWRRESEVNTIAIQSGHWGTRVHPHMHSHVHTHTHTHIHQVALIQPVFEGRFNHGDTHLGAVVAAWRWLQPSLGARWDEQSEYWHTSRRHVNSNQRCLSVNAPRSQKTDAAATQPLQSCRLSQINGQSWPNQYSSEPLIHSSCEYMLQQKQWQIQCENLTPFMVACKPKGRGSTVLE